VGGGGVKLGGSLANIIMGGTACQPLLPLLLRAHHQCLVPRCLVQAFYVCDLACV
jgi:hypothetical protein